MGHRSRSSPMRKQLGGALLARCRVVRYVSSMPECVAPEALVRKTKNLAELFLRRAAEVPDREAYRYPIGEQWRSLTWRGAAERAKAIAAGLLAAGLQREERVAILCNTRVEWILVDLGIMMAGGATTTVYPSTPADEAAFILSDSNSVIAVVEDISQLEKLLAERAQLSKVRKVILIDGAPPAGDDWVVSLTNFEETGQGHLKNQPSAIESSVAGIMPEHLATLIYTSGTTGKPKGVRLVHECWAYESDVLETIRLCNADDVQYLWLPLSHSFGKVAVALHLGSASVCAVDGRVNRIVENLAVVRPTVMAAAPRIFEKVYGKVLGGVKQDGGLKEKIFHWALAVGKRASKERQAGREPTGALAIQLRLAEKLVFSKLKARFGGRVRFFISGSAPLSRDIAEFFHACGILILEGYGLTETSAATFVNRPHRFAFGTVGDPVPGTSVRIAPDDGEILIKGPGVMRGYHNLPEATAEALSTDGWFRTGDIGEIAPTGQLRITDRKKDLIKTSGGKYIAPQAIESKLKSTCPIISQVVVHGDKRNFVSALLTLDEEAIMRWASESGMSGKSYQAVCESPEAHAFIGTFVEQVNHELARYETIKKFAILPRDLTVEAGELTPSLKVKRKAVEKKYMAVLDQFYQGAEMEST